MQNNSSSLRLLAVAFVIMVGTCLAVGQDSYIVTIDVTTNPISYSVSKNGTPQSGSAYRLYVANGDSVAWNVTTGNNDSYSAMIFFPTTPLYDRTSGRPTNSIVWSDRATPSPVSKVDASFATYEYHVAVNDEVKKKTYSDDPKIIVGSGNMGVEAKIRSAIDDLIQADTQLSGNPKLEEEAKRIEAIKNELQHILDEIRR